MWKVHCTCVIECERVSVHVFCMLHDMHVLCAALHVARTAATAEPGWY